MPEITELLEQAAPGGAGPAPLDDIVRRGHRRKVATRAAAVGAPLALAAVAVGVILTGGAPTGVVIEPRPDVAQSPDPTPTPSDTASESAEPTPEEGQTTEEPARDGWTVPANLRSDVLVVAEEGGTPQVVRLGADGSVRDLLLEDGAPGTTGLVPDGQGGFVWQPDWQGAGSVPVLHMDAEGEVRTLVERSGDDTITLVGWDHGLGRPLVTEQTGTGFDDMTADLLAVPLDGGESEVVRSGVGGWETGVVAAAVLETAIYDRYAEAMQFVVIDPPDGDEQVAYEGGETTGEDVAGVGILDDSGTGVALVARMSGLENEPAARLLFVDLATGGITDEVDVPMEQGFENGEAWPGTVARDVSVANGQVLVNRWFEGGWVAPLVYDAASGEWSDLEHREGGPVVGRAVLAPPFEREPVADPAACGTEDSLRHAPPEGDGLHLYLSCRSTEPGVVHRVAAGIESTGGWDRDLDQLLAALVQPTVSDELSSRGYYPPSGGAQVVLNSFTGHEGNIVIDLGFPDGVGNLSTGAGSAGWHQSWLGTILQFEEVDTVEFRLDGSCEDYALAFEGDGCRTFGRDMAPWNDGPGA